MHMFACAAALFAGSHAARLAEHEVDAALLATDVASSVASATPESRVTRSAVAAAELVTAGQQADTIIPRWHGAVSALHEVLEACKSAQEWQSEESRLINAVHISLADSNNGLAAAFDGMTTYDDVRAITTGASILYVADGFFYTNTQAMGLSAMLGQLANTMVLATGLSERIDEVSGVWARVDLDLVRGLEQRAQALHSTFESASGALTSGREVLHHHFQDWDELGSWTHARRAFTYFDEMKGGFEQVGQARTVIEPAFDALQPLVTDMAQAAGSLVDATREVGNFRDRGLGAIEEIRRIFCADRSLRNFGLNADIDLRSMTCEQSLFSAVGVQRCRCSSADDCYVTSEYRPEPSRTKRCFRPV